jgi:hypothetical protein
VNKYLRHRGITIDESLIEGFMSGVRVKKKKKKKKKKKNQSSQQQQLFFFLQ